MLVPLSKCFTKRVLLLSALGLLPGAKDANAAMELPLEIMGQGISVNSATFYIDDAAGIDKLYLKGHHLSYRDASINPDKAKASLRLNGGPWVDLINKNVVCYEHEAQFGCLNGAYHTVRLTLGLTGFKTGANTLEFRFNGTDGVTSGYRILELNPLRSGNKVLPLSAFTYTDPNTWKPSLTAPADIAAGKTLWEGKALMSQPGGTSLKATCADCHAKDGRDLKYFGFSDWSIEVRSQFHGMSPLEAKQLAAYIRSLPVKTPAKGRPWNPPYQPGPGTDSRPVEEWAAGAGLEAVLEKDIDLMKHVSFEKAFAIDSSFPTRETPVPLQFNDWNAWLPTIHPLDTKWGAGFLATKAHHNESVHDTYVRVSNAIASGNIDNRISDGTLWKLMNDMAEQTTDLTSTLDVAIQSAGLGGILSDSIGMSIMHWGAVKTWEIMHTHGLEDKARRIHGAQAEKYSWFTQRRNVFEMAPHRLAKNSVNYGHQSALVGKHFSTAWYQLQVTLNSGNRKGSDLWPVDWNYQPDHIENLTHFGIKQPIRYAVASHNIMLQQYNDGKIPGQGSSLGFRQIQPARYSFPNIWDDLPADQRSAILDYMLNATMDLLEKHDKSIWHGVAGMQPADYLPKLTDEDLGAVQHNGRWADAWLMMLPRFEQKGVSCAAISRLANWGKMMWPLGPWDNYGSRNCRVNAGNSIRMPDKPGLNSQAGSVVGNFLVFRPDGRLLLVTPADATARQRFPSGRYILLPEAKTRP